MIGILIFGFGLIFMMAILLSVLVNPTFAPREDSNKDARSKEMGS